MSDKITYQEYWAEVKAIAREAVSNCERNPDNAHDAAHEAVDGHQWVIYTVYNPQVLTHSASEDALFDQMGETTFTSYSDAMSKMAYFALLTDVEAEMASLFNEDGPDADQDDAGGVDA